MGRRMRQRTWTAGGVGLILCGAIGMIHTEVVGMAGTEAFPLVADVVFAASVLLFAIGLSPEASVVGRNRVGVAAMAVLAVWPLVSFGLTRLPAFGPEAETGAWTIYGYAALLVPAAAGLVAAAQIARGDTVPFPWRWAPMWALGGHALAWAIPQIVFVTVRPEEIQGFADLLRMLGALASLAGTLGLGILAIVLAMRQRPESVEVYRSEA